jgi:hypothetical protein
MKQKEGFMTLMKRHYLKCLVLLTCFIISIQTGCVRNQSVEKNSLEEFIITETPQNIIKEIQDTIIQNIKNRDDMDFGLDFEKIEHIMFSHSPSSSSSIVSVNEKLYDINIFIELLLAYHNISNFWIEYRSIEIERSVVDSIDKMLFIGEVEGYDLAETVFYFSYQSEVSASLFSYLFDLFQLKNVQDTLHKRSELSISIPNLPVTAIYIDDMPFDAIAVVALQANIETRLSSLEVALIDNLTMETNRQFAIMLENVDSYLDWYYSLRTDLSRMAIGILDLPGNLFYMLPFTPDRSQLNFDEKFMLKNYVEIIGNNTNPGDIINILENIKITLLELSLILVSLLEDSNLSFYYYTETIDTINGDKVVASFIQTMDRLDLLVFEGIPLLLGMGDGNMLDANTVALDIGVGVATTGISFIPIVGIPLSIGLDLAWVLGGSAAREGLTRTDLRAQLIYAINNSHENMINMLHSEIYFTGGEKE